jgi:hypothetical protein
VSQEDFLSLFTNPQLREYHTNAWAHTSLGGSDGGMILDCGEGSLGQLRRIYGVRDKVK